MTNANGLEVAYVVLVSVYLALGAAVVWLLRRLTAAPPHTELTNEPAHKVAH